MEEVIGPTLFQAKPLRGLITRSELVTRCRCRSNRRKTGLFRHGQPTAHWFVVSEKVCGIFVAKLLPIGPVFADRSGL